MWTDEYFDDEEMTAGQTAIAYADDFVDAAVAKLDATFGKGYAKQNPTALAGYLAACASNLGAFMTAASAMQDALLDEAAEEIGQMDAGELQAAFAALLPTKPTKSKKGKD